MTFYFGVDFYPEQWPEPLWEQYANLMEQASFNVVRLAEFAWALMEPEEGRFDFAWLDRAIQTLGAHGLSVVLGTPTATMPAWVKTVYPETLASADGIHRDPWGVRKNNCFTSGTYRRLSEAITRAMAKHYVDNPAVIGWQTDNEIDGPVCRCHTCVCEFQAYLRRTYGSIDDVNTAWGTNFWSHRYSSWDQIQAPVNYQHDNPSLCLDWQRFQTFLQVRFQHEQVVILRDICPDHFLTHNYMGVINSSNCYDLAKDLDFASFDSYPGFPVWDKRKNQFATGHACDLTRGLKDKNYWIMETTSGPVGWGEFTRNLQPGELRKIFYQHVAHGADGQLFFRWRTAVAGREQYWHGLLGHDGRPGRRYEEAACIGTEAKRLAHYLESTTVTSPVAMIYDYDSRWATEIQPGFAGNNYVGGIRRYYDAFARAGINVDIIPPTRDFSKYRVVVAPQLHVLPDNIAERLTSFVAGGGVLLADTRTGVKTETNLCHERVLPGLLSGPLGIEIDEYESVTDEYALDGRGPLSGEYAAKQYADWIRPVGAEPLAHYKQWHLVQFAAVTRNRYGSGSGYYVGTIVEDDHFYDLLTADILQTAGIQSVLAPPPGVEVSVRRGADHSLIFVINHTEDEQTVDLPKGMQDILTERQVDSQLTLDRFGVSILLSSL